MSNANTQKKEKKKILNDKQKKIVDIIVTVVQVIVIILAIAISIIVIVNPIGSTNNVASGSIKLLPVLSDSMNGADAYYTNNQYGVTFDIKTRFKTGDLIIAKNPYTNYSDYKVGDIITYVGNVNGQSALITHRIVKINTFPDGSVNSFVTRGDANNAEDAVVNPSTVKAVYKSHLKGVGNAINWLQNSTNFLLVIVLPLVLLFIYNIILVVRMIMANKLAKAQASAANNEINEEEIKRKAVEEFLAQQKAKEEAEKQETISEENNDSDNGEN
ncbi:MAG: signal peptidase I [Clostridia bacterium]|nr:signal peptidase I [Clostridia bacterium]